MATNVFINLPVSDLARSRDFYTGFGWTLDPNFSNDDAGAITISDTIHVMILTHSHWAQFTDKPVADARTTSAVINAISVEDPAQIDSLVDQAVTAGAIEGKAQDLGFMRSRSFADPDGHSWEVLWMDPIAQTGDWEAVQAEYGNSRRSDPAPAGAPLPVPARLVSRGARTRRRPGVGWTVDERSTS